MKVLLVNNRYPSANKPQVATYIVSIKECLEKAGFEVDLLISSRNFNSPLGKWIDLKLFWLKLFFFGSYSSYDYVYFNHFNLYFPFVLNKSSIAKSVFHWHGNEVFSSSKIWKVLNKFTLKKFPEDAIHLVPSEYFKKIVGDKFGVKNLHVSPSGGIDKDLFKPEEKSASEKLVIGFASHVNTEKGFDLFLDLAKAQQKNKNLKFSYIRYGSELNSFESQVQNLDNIQGVAPIPKKEMVKFYNGLDVLVMPTKRSAESLGLVSLEAMSCGVPVLGTNNFALPEYVVSSVSGELFEMGNSQKLIETFERFLEKREGYAPRKIVLEKYSHKAVAEGYKEILKAE